MKQKDVLQEIRERFFSKATDKLDAGASWESHVLTNALTEALDETIRKLEEE